MPGSGNVANAAAIAVTGIQGVTEKVMYARANHEGAVNQWRSKTHNVTYFVMDRIQSSLQHAAFGGEGEFTLSKIGDMARDVFAVIELPGLNVESTVDENGAAVAGMVATNFPHPDNAAESNSLNDCHSEDAAFFAAYTGGRDAWLESQGSSHYLNETLIAPDNPLSDNAYAHYCNAPGLAVLDQVHLSIGGQTWDKLYSHSMFFDEELEGQPGKRFGEMVGKRADRADLIVDSAETRKLYVPLDFWFAADDGDALPLASLIFSGAHFWFKFLPLNQMIVQSGANVRVTNASTGLEMTNNDLKVSVDVTYVYLVHEDRMNFALGRFSQLIKQHQHESFKTSNGSQIQAHLTFNHPVIELVFAVRRACNANLNNHFNFSGVDGMDPVRTVSLHLNGLPYMQDVDGTYLRMAVPFRCHRNIPNGFIYNISYSPDAGARGVRGSINHSQLESQVLTINLQPALSGEAGLECLVVARNHNVARFKNGTGGLVFLA